MADLAQAYDDFAAHYDQIFESWDGSMERQGAVLSRILQRELDDGRPMRVLDCACGIGTQSLALAMRGFHVEGCDMSSGAVERARLEAAKRGLVVPFSVIDMLQLAQLEGSSFDAVICIDNALPHFQTDEQLLGAVQQVYSKLRVGGLFVGSIRDYDHLVVEMPTIQTPSFYSNNGGRRIVFQVWDWLDERCYRLHLYITRSIEGAWQTVHFSCVYRAILRHELGKILVEAGFADVRWLLPGDSGFYQPIFVAHRKQ